MRCCVPCCRNDTKNTIESKGLTFHRFPKDINVKRLWTEALGIIGWEHDEGSSVCSEHFQNDDFYETKSGLRRVKSKAVPVSDIEIMSILQTKPIKCEHHEEETKVDIKNITIKQELADYDEIDISNSNNAVVQLNGTTDFIDNMYMETKVLKLEPKEEPTEALLTDVEIKQELPTDSGVTEISILNYAEAISSSTGVTSSNDNSGHIVEKQENFSKESFLTLRNQGVPRYSCKMCDYRCKTRNLLIYHIRVHERPFECDVCNKRFTRKGVLSIHLNTHCELRPYSCHRCNYKCKLKKNLSRHLLIHCEEKPFACHICPYRCKRNSTLITHVRTHTGEKPFVCHICNYRCIHLRYLKNHMKTHPVDSIFACKKCDYTCIRRAKLSAHMKIHVEAKPLACQLCDFTCSQKRSFARHMSYHTEVRPFASQIWDNRLKQNVNLTTYMKPDTEAKPLSCKICDYRCKHKGTLSVHMKSHT